MPTTWSIKAEVQQNYRGKELSEARDVKIHRLSFYLQRAEPAMLAPGHDGTLSFGAEILLKIKYLTF